jgi:hypothetical protein
MQRREVLVGDRRPSLTRQIPELGVNCSRGGLPLELADGARDPYRSPWANRRRDPGCGNDHSRDVETRCAPWARGSKPAGQRVRRS